MAARICMQLLCIKLCFITQKQRQICDKLCFKLCFTALNPDSVGKFVGKTSGTLLHLRLSYQVSTVVYSRPAQPQTHMSDVRSSHECPRPCQCPVLGIPTRTVDTAVPVGIRITSAAHCPSKRIWSTAVRQCTLYLDLPTARSLYE